MSRVMLAVGLLVLGRALACATPEKVCESNEDCFEGTVCQADGRCREKAGSTPGGAGSTSATSSTGSTSSGGTSSSSGALTCQPAAADPTLTTGNPALVRSAGYGQPTGSSGEWVHALATLSGGDVILGGRYYNGLQLGGCVLEDPNDAYELMFLARMTPEGTCVWAHAFLPPAGGTGLQSAVEAVVVDEADGIYVGARTNSGGLFAGRALEDQGAVGLVMKLDATGTPRWRTFVGGDEASPYTERVMALALGGGRLYALAEVRGALTKPVALLNQPGVDDDVNVALLALDPASGAHQASVMIAGEPNVFGHALVATGEDRLMVVGSVSGLGNDTEVWVGSSTLALGGVATSKRVFVTTLDAGLQQVAGAVLWGRESDATVRALATDEGVYLAGTAAQFNADICNVPAPAREEAFVMRVDPPLAVSWVRVATTTESPSSEFHGSVGTSLHRDGLGRIWLGASFFGAFTMGGGELVSNGVDNDVALVALGPSGAHLGSFQMGGSGDESPRALTGGVAAAGAERMWLAGSYDRAVAFLGGDVLTNSDPAYPNIFLVHVEIP
ncbi:MAG: hypothetical protein AB2A00_38140 [Myxococcota bacterium]